MVALMANQAFAEVTYSSTTVTPASPHVGQSYTATGNCSWTEGSNPVPTQAKVELLDANGKVLKNITSSYYYDAVNRKLSVIGASTAPAAGSYSVKITYLKSDGTFYGSSARDMTVVP